MNANNAAANKSRSSGRQTLPLIPGGIELRDWFAGQTLTGVIANDSTMGAWEAAKYAYEMADAMLEERKK